VQRWTHTVTQHTPQQRQQSASSPLLLMMMMNTQVIRLAAITTSLRYHEITQHSAYTAVVLLPV